MYNQTIVKMIAALKEKKVSLKWIKYLYKKVREKQKSVIAMRTEESVQTFYFTDMCNKCL